MASFTEMIHSEKPVLIDFFATWCGPCKTMIPILQDVKAKVGDKVMMYKIDIDKNQGLAATYQIQGVPTIIIFKQGKEIWRRAGVVTAHNLVAVLEKYY